MKSKFTIFLSSLLTLVFPVLALAAFNDVALNTSGTEISISSVTLTIQGGNGGEVEQLQVTADTFVPTMVANSYLKVRSADRRKFTIDPVGSLKITQTCTDTESTLELDNPAGGPSVSPTVGVSSDTCAAGGGGGGGGGGGAGVIASVPKSIIVVPPTSEIAQLSPIAQAISPVFNSDLQKGVRNADVRRLQELLAKDSSIYQDGSVTGFYGALTEQAVRKFQAKYGLPQVGRVGPATRAKLQEVFGGIVPTSVIPAPTVAQPPPISVTVVAVSVSPVFSSDLQKGMKGSDVRRLQEVLAVDPSIYPDGSTTGFYGALTEQAVRKFQAKYGLPQVGRVGPATRAKLQEIFREVEPAPTSAPVPSAAPAPVNPVQSVVPPATTVVPAPPPIESVPFWMQLKPSPRAGGASVVDPSSPSSPESPQTTEQKKAYAETLPFWMQLTQ